MPRRQNSWPAGTRRTGACAAVRKPLTSFVGRDEDVVRVLKMLDEGRLVTLTGPGGAGKTRLALETAARLSREAAPRSEDDGPGQAWSGCQVWFVELTPVTDPGDVPSAVMNALGIRESPVIAHAGAGQLGSLADPAERLVAALTGRHDLLILDNCEHVVAAAAALADQILAGWPRRPRAGDQPGTAADPGGIAMAGTTAAGAAGPRPCAR